LSYLQEKFWEYSFVFIFFVRMNKFYELLFKTKEEFALLPQTFILSLVFAAPLKSPSNPPYRNRLGPFNPPT